MSSQEQTSTTVQPPTANGGLPVQPPQALRPVLDVGRAIVLALVLALVLAFFSSGVGVLYMEISATEDLTFDTIFPSVSEVRQAWLTHQDRLLHTHIPQTLWETLSGLAIALVLGVLIAGVMDFSPVLRWVLYPVLVVSQTVPILSLIHI